MFRRSFLGALAGLPCLGFLKPPRGERQTYHMLDEAAFPRNSGRTYRALQQAIKALEKYPTVCLLVSSQAEAARLHEDAISMLRAETGCEVACYHQKGWYLAGGGALHIRSVEGSGCRGMRAHFVLDHSVIERSDDLKELLANLRHCEEAEAVEFGPMWGRSV
jgi:hypothetical protein